MVMRDKLDALIEKHAESRHIHVTTGDWRFTFGKYKGRLVVDAPGSYIMWCEENIPWLSFADDILEWAENDARDEELYDDYMSDLYQEIHWRD